MVQTFRNHPGIVMKVLIVNTVPTDKNGITNVIFNYLTAMKLDDLRMDYVSINQPDANYSLMVKQIGGRMYVMHRTAKGLFTYTRKLKKLIKSEGYDIVHIHGNSHFTVPELLAAYLGGCKVRIVHCHNTTCSSVLLHKFLTPLFNSLYTDGFACGVDAGRWMFGKCSFTVINNGIDTGKFKFSSDIRTKIREQLGWEDKIIIGNVASIIPAKNHEFILKVFEEVYNTNNDCRLLLIGDGHLRGQIEDEILEAKLQDAVIITGNINNVNEYLNAMDCILMPSLYEGLPLTLIEQQANGLQCIVSDAISIEADKTGLLTFIPLSTPAKEWADVILKKTGDKDDIRQDASEYAIMQIRDSGYSIDEEAAKMRKIYSNLIH